METGPMKRNRTNGMKAGAINTKQMTRGKEIDPLPIKFIERKRKN